MLAYRWPQRLPELACRLCVLTLMHGASPNSRTAKIELGKSKPIDSPPSTCTSPTRSTICEVNVPDIRNTRVVELVREPNDFGITVQLHDPMADADLLQEEFQLKLTPIEALKRADAVMLSVAHRRYREAGWDLVKPLLKRTGGFVADVPALLDRSSTPTGITLWRL
jgi:hypothetical protein